MSNNNGKSNGVARWSGGELDPRLLDPTGVASSKQVSFPGWEGLPFRGPVKSFKETDPDHLKPQQGIKVNVQQLNMSVEADMERYGEIGQLVGNGFAQISFEERIYDDDIKSWRILIRWFEVFTYDPEQGEDRGRVL